MKRLLASLIATSFTFAGAAMAQDQPASTPPAKAKGGGVVGDVKGAPKKVMHGTEAGVKDVGKGGEAVVKDTGKGVKKVGQETEKGFKAVGNGTKKAFEGMGHGLKKLEPGHKSKAPAASPAPAGQ